MVGEAWQASSGVWCVEVCLLLGRHATVLRAALLAGMTAQHHGGTAPLICRRDAEGFIT